MTVLPIPTSISSPITKGCYSPKIRLFPILLGNFFHCPFSCHPFLERGLCLKSVGNIVSNSVKRFCGWYINGYTREVLQYFGQGVFLGAVFQWFQDRNLWNSVLFAIMSQSEQKCLFRNLEKQSKYVFQWLLQLYQGTLMTKQDHSWLTIR